MRDAFKGSYNLFNNEEEIANISIALSSPIRLQILKEIQAEPKTFFELSKLCFVSMSAISFHINILKKARLVKIETRLKRTRKVNYVRSYMLSLDFDLLRRERETSKTNEIIQTIPIGAFSEAKGYDRSFAILENHVPCTIYDPEVYNAYIIWINKGTFLYRIPNYNLHDYNVKKIKIGLELCSEAPNFDLNWPSDITFWINDKELFTFTCKSDYGGRKGVYTPNWWPENRTQYGEWHEIVIAQDGIYDNGQRVNNLILNDLNLEQGDHFTFKVGNKENAKNQGGVNLFSSHFGDYNKDIEFKYICDD